MKFQKLSVIYFIALIVVALSNLFATNSVTATTEKFPYVENGITFHSGDSLATELGEGTHDLFVLFFAPWCGHCKSVAATWEKLAEVYSHDKNVLKIVKLDASRDNKAALKYSIKGFPTFKLLRAGSENVIIPYESGRNLEDFVSFLNKHSKVARDAKGVRITPYDKSEEQTEYMKSLVSASSEDEKYEILEKINESMTKVDISQHPEISIYTKVANMYAQKGIDALKSRSVKLKNLLQRPEHLSVTEWKDILMSYFVIKNYISLDSKVKSGN